MGASVNGWSQAQIANQMAAWGYQPTGTDSNGNYTWSPQATQAFGVDEGFFPTPPPPPQVSASASTPSSSGGYNPTATFAGNPWSADKVLYQAQALGLTPQGYQPNGFPYFSPADANMFAINLGYNVPTYSTPGQATYNSATGLPGQYSGSGPQTNPFQAPILGMNATMADAQAAMNSPYNQWLQTNTNTLPDGTKLYSGSGGSIWKLSPTGTAQQVPSSSLPGFSGTTLPPLPVNLTQGAEGFTYNTSQLPTSSSSSGSASQPSVPFQSPPPPPPPPQVFNLQSTGTTPTTVSRDVSINRPQYSINPASYNTGDQINLAGSGMTSTWNGSTDSLLPAAANANIGAINQSLPGYNPSSLTKYHSDLLNQLGLGSLGAGS